VCAVADELTLAHLEGDSEAKTFVVILAGPALYLTGNAPFKRLSAPYMRLSHLVGLGLLALLIPTAAIATPLARRPC
jgi:low temperature requirement protein LtrA